MHIYYIPSRDLLLARGLQTTTTDWQKITGLQLHNMLWSTKCKFKNIHCLHFVHSPVLNTKQSVSGTGSILILRYICRKTPTQFCLIGKLLLNLCFHILYNSCINHLTLRSCNLYLLHIISCNLPVFHTILAFRLICIFIYCTKFKWNPNPHLQHND